MRTVAAAVAGLFASLAVAVPLHAADPPRSTPPSKEVKPENASLNTPINGKMLREWVKEIKSPDPSLSETAIRMVTLFGPSAAPEAADALVDALHFTDASLRVNAALAFTMIGVDQAHAAKVVAALAQRVSEDQQAIVRFHAAVALGRVGEGYRTSISALAYRCTDPSSWEIRRAAAFALGRAGHAMGAGPGQGVDMRAAHALAQVVSGTYPDRCAEVRLTAVQALGSLGIPAMPADQALIIRALKDALRDRYKAVVIWAHVGLMALGDPQPAHMPAILAHLKGKDFEAHLEAIRALGTMGKNAKTAVPNLTNELQGSEPALVVAACWALGEMKEDARAAVPTLKELVAKKDVLEPVKTQANDALEHISGVTDKKP
jgi:HEAT repeat protein